MRRRLTSKPCAWLIAAVVLLCAGCSDGDSALTDAEPPKSTMAPEPGTVTSARDPATSVTLPVATAVSTVDSAPVTTVTSAPVQLPPEPKTEPESEPSLEPDQKEPVSEQEYEPASEQDQEPVSEQEYEPVSEQEYEPESEQEYEPVSEQEYEPVSEQEYEPESEQEYEPVSEQEYEPESEQEYEPESEQECEPESATATDTAAAVDEAAVVEFPAHRDWLVPIALDYPHMHQVGLARVYSDIGAEFSRDHAVVLDRVFRFFSRYYSQSRGPAIEAFYTQQPEVFKRVVEHCPTVFVPGARNLTACYGDIARWFIMPYQVPDFGTLHHEIGHDFLFATFPESEQFPWFKEGTAMYFESGEFDASGDLVVTEPLGYCTILYDRAADAGALIPLRTLLHTPKLDFLADNERTYSQSCMFVHYLVNEHPGVLEELVARINRRDFVSNDDLVAALVSGTGIGIDELEVRFRRYAS